MRIIDVSQILWECGEAGRYWNELGHVCAMEEMSDLCRTLVLNNTLCSLWRWVLKFLLEIPSEAWKLLLRLICLYSSRSTGPRRTHGFSYCGHHYCQLSTPHCVFIMTRYINQHLLKIPRGTDTESEHNYPPLCSFKIYMYTNRIYVRRSSPCRVIISAEKGWGTLSLGKSSMESHCSSTLRRVSRWIMDTSLETCSEACPSGKRSRGRPRAC